LYESCLYSKQELKRRSPVTGLAEVSSVLRQRRLLLSGAAALAGLPAFAADRAADYPSRPITLILPWPAGGQTDVTMRILVDLASDHLGQPVVIDNRPGAAGTLVGPMLRNAAPDGYTIGQLPITLYRAALLYKVDWNPQRDIAPVIQISGQTFGIVVPADSALRTFADLVNWGRDHQGRLTVGSTGIGSTAHLAMEDVLSREGVSYIHVPYKGTSDQMLAVATNTLMVGVNSTGFAPYIENGKLRLLATFNAQRSKRWPDAPTMRELGYPEAVYTSPYGIGMPAGGDPLVIRKLHDAFRLALFDPRHVQALANYDMEPEYLDTADYGRYVRDANVRERALLGRLGLLKGTA
jgi:tripartite-type tricarboxylate transporter receptor subunit TctC